MILLTRLTSKSLQTLVISIAISIVYTINYVVVYLFVTFAYTGNQTMEAQNAAFIPYD